MPAFFLPVHPLFEGGFAFFCFFKQGIVMFGGIFRALKTSAYEGENILTYRGEFDSAEKIAAGLAVS